MLRSALLAARVKAEIDDQQASNIAGKGAVAGGSNSGNTTPLRPISNGASTTPRSASGGGWGIVSFKPFKLPSSKLVRDVPKRLAAAKRKRPNYKEEQLDEEDSDGTGKRHKKRHKDGNDDGTYNDADGGDEENGQKAYPVYEPKPSATVLSTAFNIPVMKDKKTGAIIETRLSFGALGVCRRAQMIPRPLHDPLADHAIVLWDPTVDDIETEEDKKAREEAEKAAEEKKKLQDKSGIHKSLAAMLGLDKAPEKDPAKVKVPVVIDPRLSKVLRPHQVEGVKFLYRASTGMIASGAQGCIMADEMGLGKTLQCISLLWTLLKQSPRSGKGTIDKAIVTCPASLVRNWANELVKWLGPSAINPLAIDGSKPKHEVIAEIRQWCSAHGRAIIRPVIIVSYETLRSLTEELGNSPVGLLLCDEAHRLKNSQNQTYTALNSINVQRRVLLTGTPIQNDLTEYFALLDFAVPGYLGTRVEFKKNFENAIMHGRNADASDSQIEKCQAKLKELTTLVNRFVIRRTNDLLTKYLPVKYEHVVFCALSPFQLALYRLFVSSPEIKALIKGKGSNPLVAIGMLQKLCNHPDLVNLERDLPGSEKLFPEGYSQYGRKREVWPALSGKMLVLERFLDKMRAESDDKIVLISNYTETLDVIERLLNAKRYGYFRLEGSTNIKKRQKLVDQFNDPEGKEFVFLLSSKAGGCGINLIGANRLVLFDPDWNPAADQQALARVWRDGQKKNCFVYRFIATGTLEEKIFQRQAHKQALSSCVVDDNEAAERHFSKDSLRQLFDYQEGTLSETHDTFKCKRCKGGKQLIKSPAMLYGDTSTWNHLSNSCLKNIHDDLLRAETDLEAVTAVFQVSREPCGFRCILSLRLRTSSFPRRSVEFQYLQCG